MNSYYDWSTLASIALHVWLCANTSRKFICPIIVMLRSVWEVNACCFTCRDVSSGKKSCINHSGKFLADQVFLHVEEIAYKAEANSDAEIWVGGSSRRKDGKVPGFGLAGSCCLAFRLIIFSLPGQPRPSGSSRHSRQRWPAGNTYSSDRFPWPFYCETQWCHQSLGVTQTALTSAW